MNTSVVCVDNIYSSFIRASGSAKIYKLNLVYKFNQSLFMHDVNHNAKRIQLVFKKREWPPFDVPLGPCGWLTFKVDLGSPNFNKNSANKLCYNIHASALKNPAQTGDTSQSNGCGANFQFRGAFMVIYITYISLKEKKTIIFSYNIEESSF